MGLFDKIFGTYSERELKDIRPVVDKILAMEEEYKALSDEALKAKTAEFKERYKNGESLDALLPEAFATVREAVDELKKETFRIDAPRMPNGSASTLHLAITDETGNTAILEYLDGKLSIHEGKEYRVMTNSPRYEYQLAVNDYWKEVGGLQMLPGTNRSSDRFVRASFYIHAIPQTADAAIAVPSVLSVMRNVSVPFGITTPDKPHISSTRWRSVANQKDKVYYFESTLTPNLFWLDLKKMDFSPQAKVKKLSLTNGEVYAGDAVKDLKDSPSFTFLFQTPVF